MGLLIDLTGLKFTRLFVVRRDKSKSKNANQVYWICRCDCGVEMSVLSQHLRRGATKSCGCYSSDMMADRNRKNGTPKKAVDALRERSTTHGMSGTAEYRIWHGMRQRCSGSAKPADRKSYYDRGIRVSDEWDSFKQFFRDMGPRPAGMTIERINNDGNYESGNCKWATTKEQGRNRRTTKFSETDIEQIKILASSGKKHSKIGEQFGVSDNYISRIVTGRIWS